MHGSISYYYCVTLYTSSTQKSAKDSIALINLETLDDFDCGIEFLLVIQVLVVRCIIKAVYDGSLTIVFERILFLQYLLR